MKANHQGPKILLIDIETAPLVSYSWGLFDQNIALNQIKQDWNIISFGAKWLNLKDPKVIYHDQRKAKNIENDKPLLEKLWKLMDEADIIVSQNGRRFDTKKINARLVFHGFKPPSSYRQIDTLQLAKKHFGFTSNKLEYMADKLNVKYKKLKHDKFAGFELWKECLKGNQKAWKEMEKYNKYDVLSLEELYSKLIPWDNSVAFSIYNIDSHTVCTCGSTEFNKNGFFYSSTGRYQRYSCKKCGSELRDRKMIGEKPSKVGTTR